MYSFGQGRSSISRLDPRPQNRSQEKQQPLRPTDVGTVPNLPSKILNASWGTARRLTDVPVRNSAVTAVASLASYCKESLSLFRVISRVYGWWSCASSCSSVTSEQQEVRTTPVSTISLAIQRLISLLRQQFDKILPVRIAILLAVQDAMRVKYMPTKRTPTQWSHSHNLFFHVVTDRNTPPSLYCYGNTLTLEPHYTIWLEFWTYLGPANSLRDISSLGKSFVTENARMTMIPAVRPSIRAAVEIVVVLRSGVGPITGLQVSCIKLSLGLIN
jgi:hypothetical protein